MQTDYSYMQLYYSLYRNLLLALIHTTVGSIPLWTIMLYSRALS